MGSRHDAHSRADVWSRGARSPSTSASESIFRFAHHRSTERASVTASSRAIDYGRVQSNKPAKPPAPSARAILDAVRGRLPVQVTEAAGYRWTQTIPKSSAAAWAFAEATAKVGDAAITEMAETMGSTSGVNLGASARFTTAMLVPSIAASLSHISIARTIPPVELPVAEGMPPAMSAPTVEWDTYSVSEMFPLAEDRAGYDPTQPRYAEFGEPDLCDVVARFIEQLPDPLVQELATVANRLQNEYTKTAQALAAPNFPKAQPASS